MKRKEASPLLLLGQDSQDRTEIQHVLLWSVNIINSVIIIIHYYLPNTSKERQRMNTIYEQDYAHCSQHCRATAEQKYCKRKSGE